MRIHAISVGMLLACTSSALMAQVANAPCFEPNLGTMIGTGDDVVFPSNALGFTFNYGGSAYTDIQVCSNGFAWLGNTANSNPRCCAGTGATFVTDPPSVAPLWTDLVADTNSNGIWFNALPGRAVVTWSNVIEFGQTTRFTIQMQLTSLGEVTFWYSPTTAITTTFHSAVAGITVGNGANNPGSIDLSASFPYNSSAEPTVYEEWAGGTFDLATRTWELVPNGNNGFLALDRPACAFTPGSFTPYGSGCPALTIANADFYQFFVPGSGFDLAGTAIEMLPIGTLGYVVQPTSLNANWFAGFTNATNIGDDQVLPTALPFTFPHPGGSTASVGLCSNGFIHLSASTAAPFTSNVADFLAGGPRIFGAWTDWYRPGAGQVYSDQVSPTMWAFTWSGVAEFANTSPAGTWQIQLENTGRILLLYQSMAIVSHNILVGYSRGGGIADPGSVALSSVMPFTTGTGATSQPLLLSQDSGNPVIGTTYHLRLSQQPATATAAFLLLSFTQFPNGIPLDNLGMTGCRQYLAPSVSLFHAIGSPNTVFPVALPNNTALVGLSAYAQAAELAAGVNPLGIAASNGGTLVMGTF